MPQDLVVSRLLRDLYALLFKIPLDIRRIIPSCLHIRAEPVHDAHLLLALQHIRRIAGVRVLGGKQVHVAHLELRIFLMREADRLSACQELMVKTLEPDLRLVRNFGHRSVITADRPEGKHCAHGHSAGVDLIESEPVFDLVLIPVKDHLDIAHEVIDHFSPVPAVVSFNQAVRELIVGNGHKGLDAVFCQLVEYLVIESETGLIGLIFHSGGEDPGPVDGHAEDLKSHFRCQGNVLFVVVIEIGRLPAGIERALFKFGSHTFGAGVASIRAVIGDGSAFAVRVPRAFILIGGCGAAPQKIFSESSHSYSLQSLQIIIRNQFDPLLRNIRLRLVAAEQLSRTGSRFRQNSSPDNTVHVLRFHLLFILLLL